MAFNIEFAFDVQKRVNEIIEVLGMDYVDPASIVCMRSTGSKSRALARVWPLEKAWQKALSVGPHYIIEVVSPAFDKLPEKEQIKTLIHELLHIPKGFSGSLVPHKCFGKRISKKQVEELYLRYESCKKI